VSDAAAEPFATAGQHSQAIIQAAATCWSPTCDAVAAKSMASGCIERRQIAAIAGRFSMRRESECNALVVAMKSCTAL